MERNEDLNEALATVDAMVAVCCFFDVYKMRKGHTILINKVYATHCFNLKSSLNNAIHPVRINNGIFECI